MGLDKRKKILVREEFEVDPFKATNIELSSQVRSSLPTTADDVYLDRHLGVYYSVEYALKRLMQNDKFIDDFLNKSLDLIELAIDQGLLTSLNCSVDVVPSSTPIYENYYNRHMYEYHGGQMPPGAGGITPASMMLDAVDHTYANASMDNFDALAARRNFLKRSTDTSSGLMSGLSASDNIVISNDVLVRYEFDDSPTVKKATNYVNVSVSNAKTYYKFRLNISEQVSILDTLPSLTECKYIYKEWLSGFKELYIYVPTTYTFYNHNEADGDINGHATWICVKINKRHFLFNHIYQAHICGQSLPMQIHEDDGERDGFTDVILPSILRTMCTSSSGSASNSSMIYDSYQSQYVLYFACYGTDALAIRIFGD